MDTPVPKRRVDFGSLVFACYFMAVLLVPTPAFIALRSARAGELAGVLAGSTITVAIVVGATLGLATVAKYYGVRPTVPIAVGSVLLGGVVTLIAVLVLGAPPDLD